MTELIIDLSEKEVDALDRLSATQQMSKGAVLRQGLMLYEMNHIRTMSGETVTWSGDEQRTKDFVGDLYKKPVPTIKQTFDAKRTYLEGMEHHYPGLDPRLTLLGVDDNDALNYKLDAYGYTLVKNPSNTSNLLNKILIAFGLYYLISSLLKLLGAY